MTYFLVRQPSSSKIIGVRDGGSQAKIDRKGFVNKEKYDEFEKVAFGAPGRYWENIARILEFDFDLECVRLRKGAKLTDFLSYYPNLYCGGKFLVSEKALNVLLKFKLPNYKIFSAKVFYNDTPLNNYSLFVTETLVNNINFKKTVFFKGSELIGKELFQLSSFNEFIQKSKSDIFRTEKINLQNWENENFDYFIPRISIPHIFISKKLKMAIEENKLTGLSISEAKEPQLDFEL